MTVQLEKIVLGLSPITDTIFAGVTNKAGNKWLKKTDVTQSFINVAIQRWDGQIEEITDGTNTWEISVKKVANKKG